MKYNVQIGKGIYGMSYFWILLSVLVCVDITHNKISAVEKVVNGNYFELQSIKQFLFSVDKNISTACLMLHSRYQLGSKFMFSSFSNISYEVSKAIKITFERSYYTKWQVKKINLGLAYHFYVYNKFRLLLNFFMFNILYKLNFLKTSFLLFKY